MNYLAAHPWRVAMLAGAHVELVAVALAAALLFALPIGIVAVRRPRVYAEAGSGMVGGMVAPAYGPDVS